MIDVYKIGATLVLNDLVAPQLLKLAAEFRKVDALAANLNSHLAKLDTHVGGIRALSRASRTMATNFGRANSEAAQLARGINAVHAAGVAASRSAFIGHLGGGGPGGGTRPPALPGPGGYISGVPRRGGAGVAGGGGFGGGHGGNVHVGPGGFGMGAVGFGLPAGAIAPVAAGFGALYVTKALYDAGKEFQVAAARFRTLNLGEAVNQDAEKFARGTKVFGASSAQLMETLRESVGMFGGIEKARAVAPTLAALNAANSGLFSGKIGAIDEGSVRAIMRFNDMRGLTDTPQDFLRGLDLAQRMVTGSGGSLKFTDLEQMAKTGGAAFKGLSDEGIMMLATLAQEQGGARTGTALMSLYQNLIAGRTPKKTMAALANAGLAELTEVTSGSVGGKQIKSTALKNIVDEKMLRENPGAWLMKYGTEAAKRAGATDESQVIAFMNNLVSNRQGSNMAANFTTQQAQALRDFNLIKNAKGVQGTIDEFKNTAPGAEADFIAAWESMKAEMGRGVLPMVTKLLNAGTEFFRAVNDWGLKNADMNQRLQGIGSPFSLDPRDTGSGGMLGWLWRAGKTMLSGDPVAPGGKDKLATANPVSGAAPQTVQVNSTIKLDSRVLAEATTFHQAKELARPLTGPSGFDASMALRPPALK
ncbi:hypothetical protein BKK79_20010 [Cupriavidus sp. USMAA2-4]|uniref:hypothetical protein n=1 Tax=Cupriavidus sp. USMAA2-4 TaxID=876364 RepID=UPI0008A668C7|nr:hypothetical protein [Cupriavidus sp. USMAA2-4]AOY93833.1 hypothetical protein BKK79_20010 [Cupriavidus sp. USMAA2-4]